MKNQNRTQLFKQFALLVVGALSVSLIYAQLSIPTNINNAVQTIKEIRLTSDGTSAGSTMAILNGSGATSTLQVSGNILAGKSMGTDDGTLNKIIGALSSIIGGFGNFIKGDQSTIVGGNNNILTGHRSVIVGGQNNKVNANDSTAGGQNAQALHNNTWVWSDRDGSYDSMNADPYKDIFASKKANTFLIRALNGVGINTNNPVAGVALTVNGKIAGTSICDAAGLNCSLPSQIITGTKTSLTANTVLKWNGTSVVNSQVYDNGTRVGIATTAPTAGYALDVSGSTIVSSGVYAVRFHPWAAAADWIAQLRNTLNKFVFNNAAGSALLSILGSGDVGIGTTTPHTKLEVNGRIVTTAGYTANNSLPTMYDVGAQYIGATSSIYSYGAICTNNAASQCNGSNGVVLGVVNVAAQTNIPTNGNVFFNNGSNVGIGTTGPATKLDVVGSATFGNNPGSRGSYANGLSLQNNSATATSLFLWQNGVASSHIGFKSNDNTLYIVNATSDGSINNTSNIALTTAGKVGIGINAPSEKLEISGNVSVNTNGVPFVISSYRAAGSPGYNIFIGSGGYLSRRNANEEGSYNIGIGFKTLLSNTTGHQNVAIGQQAMQDNTSGSFNVAVGPYSLYKNTEGFYNTALGNRASRGNTTGNYNTAVGLGALYTNFTGNANTAIGTYALYYGLSHLNTAIGYYSLMKTTIGSRNVAIGPLALYESTTGSGNVAIGMNAARYISGGAVNTNSLSSVYLGTDVRAGVANGTNEIVIGASAQGNGSNTVTLGNTAITKTFLQGEIKSPGLWAKGTAAQANGAYSTAMGQSTANGNTSTAMGQSIARGDYSTAMGQGYGYSPYSTAMGSAQAYGSWSTAMGNSIASSDYSTAMGFSSAAGYASTAMGYGYAIGQYSTSMGQSTANADYSTAMGQSTANQRGSTAMGTSYAGPAFSTAMGNSQAYGYTSAAMGNSQTNGDRSTAMGVSTANGAYSTAMGQSTANSAYSTAMGQSTANSAYSTAMGAQTQANAYASTAMGYQTQANGSFSTAIGQGTNALADNSFALGTYNLGLANSLLEVGYGASAAAKANAFAVMANGTVVASVSIETPKLIVDKLVNRTVTNIQVSGQLLPDTSAPAALQIIGNITTPWKQLYAGGISAIANGNVGIGTGSPAYKLDVVGTGKFLGLRSSAYCDVNGANCLPQLQDVLRLGGIPTANYLTKWNGTNALVSSMLYDNGASLGIGTTTLVEKLTVNGNIKSNGFWSKGSGAQANAPYSTAIGYNTQANGSYSTAIGANAQTIGDYSTAMGQGYGYGAYSTALGTSQTYGAYSAAMGSAVAGSDYSTAMGISSAGGIFSTAMGNSQAYGYTSTAMGQSTANGDTSTAMGYYSQANGNYSTAMGFITQANAPYSTAIGQYNVGLANSLFEVGNGTSSATSNALTVLDNGNVGIGTTNPLRKLVVAGPDDGNGQLRLMGTLDTVRWWDIGRESAVNGRFKINEYNNGVESERLSILMGGNVGIGIAAPTQKLDVVGVGKFSSGVRAPSYCDLNGANCFAPSASTLVAGGTQTVNYLTKWNGSNALVSSTVYDNGTYVGIGTTTLTEKLTVNGNIKSNGFWSKGSGVQANGSYSTAIGRGTIASGDYSTAMGTNTKATQFSSTAMGYLSVANAQSTTAMGYQTQANGNFSTAMGNSTQANGSSTTAMGNSTQANGDSSTAMGNSTIASGSYSTAMGYSTRAPGNSSTAMGRMAIASGAYSFAVGYNTVASGPSSAAIGYFSKAIGNYSIAMGSNTTATGVASMTMGSNTTARGASSFAMGSYAEANRDYSISMGSSARANGTGSIAIGSGVQANGFLSFAMGNIAQANGQQSFAIGAATQANGLGATAMGISSIASGIWSTAMGYVTIANGDYSTAMGSNTQANAASSTAIGQYNIGLSTSLFEIGNGISTSNRSNAFTVLTSGSVGIGITAPTQKLDVIGTGKFGSGVRAPSYCDLNGANCFTPSASSGLVAGGTQTVNYLTKWNGSNALISSTVYDNGTNVGIGTTSVSAKLHLKEVGKTELYGTDTAFPSSNLLLEGSATGRLVGNGPSLTFALPANTDGTNVWSQARILATPDNNNNGDARGRLYFQVRDLYNPGVGGTWNRRSAMVIQANGNIGIGNTSPSQKLTVSGMVLADGFFYSSDIRLKKDLKPLDNSLDKINQLNGYSFSWKATDNKDIGVIAQEVEKVYPELVHENADGIKSVEYANLVAPIIEAIKSLTYKIDQLFAKYVDQESRIDALEKKLQSLELAK